MEATARADSTFVVNGDLAVHPVALILPPMSDEEYAEFKTDILGNGLIDPIVIFQGMILDGRNRYNACRDLGIEITARQWEGGMDPVEYVVSKNIHRRQLTPAQRAVAAAKAIAWHSEEAKKRQREHGGTAPGKAKTLVADIPQVIADKARDQVGKLFGVSGRSVAAAKYVLDHGTTLEKDDLEAGKAAVTTLEKEVRQRVAHEPAEKPKFNRTNDNIEWAKWSWNPVTGCKHGCPYCYARDIAQRFIGHFNPEFHEDRLSAPSNTPVPKSDEPGIRNVFVCSMADLFGDWVPQEWIDKVIAACTEAQQWNFIFLTKNPKRYLGIDWPSNAWVGATADTQERYDEAFEVFKELRDIDYDYPPSVTFLSCEPLEGHIGVVDPVYSTFDGDTCSTRLPFDWVIIGGRSESSKLPAKQPEWEWVENILIPARDAGCSVYFKPNLTVRPKEYPKGGRP